MDHPFFGVLYVARSFDKTQTLLANTSPEDWNMPFQTSQRYTWEGIFCTLFSHETCARHGKLMRFGGFQVHGEPLGEPRRGAQEVGHPKGMTHLSWSDLLGCHRFHLDIPCLMRILRVHSSGLLHVYTDTLACR